jgi:hypothetical protein
MVQKIIAAGLHSADQDCNAYTADLMERLEQAKAQNPNEDAILDDVAASAYCEQFALQTLAKGDKEMAEDKATKCAVLELVADCHTDCAQQHRRHAPRGLHVSRHALHMEEGRPRGCF